MQNTIQKTSRRGASAGPFVGCGAALVTEKRVLYTATVCNWLESVLPCLDDVLRHLAAKCDGVRAIVLGEAAQNGKLRAKHVALGHGCDDLSSGELDLVEGRGGVDPRHRYRDAVAFFRCGNLLRTKQGGLHGEDLDNHVGDRAHHL